MPRRAANPMLAEFTNPAPTNDTPASGGATRRRRNAGQSPVTAVIPETRPPQVTIVHASQTEADSSESTVRALASDWVDDYTRSGRSPEQIQWYATIAQKNVLPKLGNHNPAFVTEQDIVQVLSQYANQIIPYIDTYEVMRSLFRYARRKGILTESPVPDLDFRNCLNRGKSYRFYRRRQS